jgi:hypothetical protein
VGLEASRGRWPTPILGSVRVNVPSLCCRAPKRYSYGLTFLGFYTYSKDITISTSSPFLSRAMDRGRSGSDRRHSINGSMNCEIPAGKGRHFLNRGGVLILLFGGYDMVWTYAVGSGMSLTFGYSGSTCKYTPSNEVTMSGWQDLGGDRWTAATTVRPNFAETQ